MVRRVAKWVLIATPVVLVVIQFVPYGRSHDNPATTAEPRWSSPRVLQLAKDACFDCHSNETTWPWYSNVAPVSWGVQHDVDSGRATLNFSEWNRPQEAELDELVEVVKSGEMPPWYYRIAHPNSRLSDAEKAALAAGLAQTVRNSPPGP
ncbi:MAG: heme-binding domain-containing protein [Gaiellaceae bacterium]